MGLGINGLSYICELSNVKIFLELPDVTDSTHPGARLGNTHTSIFRAL